jgi:hypothetical protein
MELVIIMLNKTSQTWKDKYRVFFLCAETRLRDMNVEGE